jgi:hypothetical protein
MFGETPSQTMRRTADQTATQKWLLVNLNSIHSPRI